jgi:hypothetical protein
MSRLAFDAEIAEAVAELLTDSPETSADGLLVTLAAAPDPSVIADMRDNDVLTVVYPSEYTVDPVSRDGLRHEIGIGVTLMRRAINTFAEAKVLMINAANVRAALTRQHLTIGTGILAEWQTTTSDRSIEHDPLRTTQGIVMIHILARYSVHTHD